MRISERGKKLIKSFEGCRLKAYKVHYNEEYYTIGYGHYGKDVKKDMIITMSEADRLFDEDLFKFEQAVNNFKFTFVPNQNQFDALVSFCYNLGQFILNDFRGMTASQIAKDMLLYVNSGGTRLEGLVNRRKKEVELFNTPINLEEYTIEEYYETGTFYPNTKIFFRDKPNVSNDSSISGNYINGELVHYDKVVITNKYVYISWVSKFLGIRRFMPIREYNKGVYGKPWGLIK